MEWLSENKARWRTLLWECEAVRSFRPLGNVICIIETKFMAEMRACTSFFAWEIGRLRKRALPIAPSGVQRVLQCSLNSSLNRALNCSKSIYCLLHATITNPDLKEPTIRELNALFGPSHPLPSMQPQQILYHRHYLLYPLIKHHILFSLFNSIN